MPLRLFLAFFTSLLVAVVVAQAQTPATGAVTITVSGFNAVTNYSRNGGQKTSQQLANALAAKLNTATSPVNAVVVRTKITLTSKLAGTLSNYPLSTRVTYSSA